MALREAQGSVRERRPGAAHASWTAADWARGALVAAAAGLFMALVGAFGSGSIPLAMRVVYWTLPMLVGTAVARATYFGMARLPGLGGSRAAQLVLTTLLMAALYTPLVMWWVNAVWRTGRIGLLATFPMVLLISATMTTLNLLVERRRAAAAPAPSPPAAARFLQRLPLPLRSAELHALEAEDHYLRVRTSRGSELILCRMADAVAELEGVEGLRVHRSWWVAKAAVAKVARSDGRASLTLKDGTEAPVSRTAMPLLKEQGWL